MNPRCLPRTWRDVVPTVLDAATVVLLAAVAVGGVLIGEPLFVAIALVIGVAALLARWWERAGVELANHALDVAQLRRELDSCETELAQALDELARRDIAEGGER